MKNQKDYNKFETLDAWKEAHQLVLLIYKNTGSFPSSEKYGLQSQIRRAAVSAASNLVEGNDRHSSKEFLQFCYMAKASLSEVTYQVLLSHELKYLNDNHYQQINDQCIKVSKLITGLIKFLKQWNVS